ncbi:MAG: carbohydrate ABC transporter permease [Christensenellales bacterium]|jgi:putative aldouronate transport system permease protein
MGQYLFSVKKRSNRIRIGNITFDIILTLLLLAFCVIILYPFLNIIAISLSSSGAITRGDVGLIPLEVTYKGYEIVFGQETIYTAYAWTLWYSLLFTALSVSLTTCLGYTLSVPGFVLSKPLTIMLLITMFFNGGTIPAYLNIKNLGLMNTTWALVLPGCVSAWNVFMYRSFFKGISHEIREAALIDGAGEMRILLSIILPLSKALIASFSLFAIVGMWNSYFSALLYIKDQSRMPIQMILRSIIFSNSLTASFGGDTANMITDGSLNPLNVQYACLIATIAPLLLIYPFIQKYFEQGMQVGAVKG